MFTLKNVTFLDILNIPSLTIRSNTVTCIVGASGSGKTTLLKMLNLITSPTSGEVYYLGAPLSQANAVEHRKRVMMLPQTPVIYEGSIKDNLLSGFTLRGETPPQAKELNNMLSIVGLEQKRLLDDAADLSGGEKQRLCLARVVLLDPDVFLLDEPSSALDHDTEAFIIENMCRITREKGKSLVMVTHSQAVASGFAGDTIRLEKGKIVEIIRGEGHE